VLDAVMADNAAKSFAADLKHRGCLFGGKNFQNVEIDSVRVLTWETTGKTRKSVSLLSMPER
jgi:hypothetical protein